MAGYQDTYEKIISTLMGRPPGTEIQPENHQDYALNMLNYIRSVELLLGGGGILMGIADEDTVPVQSNTSSNAYIKGVDTGQSLTFTNFIGEDGNPITVTTSMTELKIVILLWNTQYWSKSETVMNLPSMTKESVGLDQVDNTSDENKPISNATQIALDTKLDKTYVEDVTTAANNAITGANTAADNTNAAISNANSATTAATEAAESANEVAGEASETIERLEELEESLVDAAKMKPTGLTIEYPSRITLGNKVRQKITALLQPEDYTDNLLFLGSQTVLQVDPDGSFVPIQAGIERVNVIPTESTRLYKTAVIQVTSPVIRQVTKTSMRLITNGIRLT